MRGYPPSAGTIQTCGVPLMFEMKLTHLPSGENRGATALPTRAIRATAVATSCDLADEGAEFWLAVCARTAAPTQLTAATTQTRPNLMSTLLLFHPRIQRPNFITPREVRF